MSTMPTPISALPVLVATTFDTSFPDCFSSEVFALHRNLLWLLGSLRNYDISVVFRERAKRLSHAARDHLKFSGVMAIDPTIIHAT